MESIDLSPELHQICREQQGDRTGYGCSIVDVFVGDRQWVRGPMNGLVRPRTPSQHREVHHETNVLAVTHRSGTRMLGIS